MGTVVNRKFLITFTVDHCEVTIFLLANSYEIRTATAIENLRELEYYFIYLYFIFNNIIVDIIITVVPIAIITYVLFLLFKQTYKKYFISNLISVLSLCGILSKTACVVGDISNKLNIFSISVNACLISL